MGHGHVIPNADGSKKDCGGPSMCSACIREIAGLVHNDLNPAMSMLAYAIAHLLDQTNNTRKTVDALENGVDARFKSAEHRESWIVKSIGDLQRAMYPLRFANLKPVSAETEKDNAKFIGGKTYVSPYPPPYGFSPAQGTDKDRLIADLQSTNNALLERARQAERKVKRARWLMASTNGDKSTTEFKRGWYGACEAVTAALNAPYEAPAGPDVADSTGKERGG